MASSDIETSVAEKMFVGDGEANRSVSESKISKQNKNINYLLDNLIYRINWTLNGYFRPTSISNSVDGVIRIDREYTILSYWLACDDVGSANITEINIGVYDSNDAFLYNLFGAGGSALTVGTNSPNKTGVVIGRVVSPASTIDENIGGVNYQHGVLNTTTLNAGEKLRFFVSTGAKNAKNFNFHLNLGGN